MNLPDHLARIHDGSVLTARQHNDAAAPMGEVSLPLPEEEPDIYDAVAQYRRDHPQPPYVPPVVWPAWRHVETESPEPDDLVLARCGPFLHIAWFDGHGDAYWCNHTTERLSPTHWMPLPSLPA